MQDKHKYDLCADIKAMAHALIISLLGSKCGGGDHIADAIQVLNAISDSPDALDEYSDYAGMLCHGCNVRPGLACYLPLHVPDDAPQRRLL